MELEVDELLEWFPIADYSKRLDICDISWRLEDIVFTLVEETSDNIEQKQRCELIWNSSFYVLCNGDK